MDGRRPIRIAEQLRHEVSAIVEYELNDERVGFITVTDVEVTPDLRQAKVFITSMSTDEEKEASLAALNHASGFIRRELGARLRMRYTPQLSFFYDHSIERGARIEELLKEEAARMDVADDSSTLADKDSKS